MRDNYGKVVDKILETLEHKLSQRVTGQSSIL